MRKIKFRGVNRMSGKIEYGLSPSFFRTLCGETIEEFVGLVDCNNDEIYTNDQLYSIDSDKEFHFEWSHKDMAFVRKWSNSVVGRLEVREKTIINFSSKLLLTKSEFKEKYFTNSFYFIGNDNQGTRIQYIALFMGLLLHNNNAHVIKHINTKMLMMFKPDVNHKTGYFQSVDMFIENASYGAAVDVNQMFIDFDSLYNKGLL